MSDLFKREKLAVRFMNEVHSDVTDTDYAKILNGFMTGYSVCENACAEDLENCRKKLQEANEKINKLEVKVDDLERQIMGDNW